MDGGRKGREDDRREIEQKRGSGTISVTGEGRFTGDGGSVEEDGAAVLRRR